MGAAAVEPDVEDVGDHLVIVGIAVAEQGRGILGGPGVDALFFDGGNDPVIHLAVDQHFACPLLNEQRDGDAPGALAADHPIGAAVDHGGDTVAALFGYEAGVRDRLHCELAQARRDHRIATVILRHRLG
jgi:hypothetical protein